MTRRRFLQYGLVVWAIGLAMWLMGLVLYAGSVR
jgi:hypothetical protein